MSGKSADTAQAIQVAQPGDNQGIGAAHAPCKQNNDPRLLVKVYCDTGGRKYLPATVKASKGGGAAVAKTSHAKTGIADYAYVASGTYTLKVDGILAPEDKDYFADAKSTATITLAAGDKQTVEIPVERKNTVTPKLEAEYLAVLLERKLADHQAAAEPKKFHAQPTYVEVSFSEANPAYKYLAGARFTCAPANVDVYLDEKCEAKDKLAASGDLTDAQLRAHPKLKLYLKGKAAGKFTAKFELKDPADAKIRIEDKLELKMGVVELEMKLHKPDIAKIKALTVNPDVDPISTYHKQLKDLDLPDPIEMTDKEKVNPGRLLHVQKKSHFSRAKLVIKKYDKDHWPDGCEDYEVVLNSDYHVKAIEIHGKEWDSNPKDILKIKVSDLKKKDHEYWIEGKIATGTDADARYDLGLDRADGGLLKSPKRNGDWVRFRVVQISLVKIDYTPAAGAAAAWDAGKKRFYINLQADPAGRKATLGAQLSGKFQDVEIHFMLVPDKHNGKKANWGGDLPGTWIWKDIQAALKHKDKNARTEYLHLSAKTDATGYAKVDVDLSRFGGDKFHPAAYLQEDAHLAKYVHGHADLGEKKPALSAAPITVWRKLWYQITKPQGLTPVPATLTVAAYEKVYTELELDQTLDFDAASAPAQTFYPESMLKPGSSSATQVATIGSNNKKDLAKKLVDKPDQPVKRHLLVCKYQCDAKGFKSAQLDPISSDIHGQWVDVQIDNSLFVLDPPLNGGSMIKTMYWTRDSDATHHAMAATEARIPVPRNGPAHIQVRVPAIAPPPAPNDKLQIYVECHMAKEFLGESFDDRHTLAVYDDTEKKDYQDTITHEFGHSFNQTPKPGKQPDSPNIPDHPKQKNMGQGNHCQVNNGTALLSGETKYTCVMYDSGPMTWGKHKFCKTCHPYLLVEDFHRP